MTPGLLSSPEGSGSCRGVTARCPGPHALRQCRFSATLPWPCSRPSPDCAGCADVRWSPGRPRPSRSSKRRARGGDGVDPAQKMKAGRTGVAGLGLSRPRPAHCRAAGKSSCPRAAGSSEVRVGRLAPWNRWSQWRCALRGVAFPVVHYAGPADEHVVSEQTARIRHILSC